MLTFFHKISYKKTKLVSRMKGIIFVNTFFWREIFAGYRENVCFWPDFTENICFRKKMCKTRAKLSWKCKYLDDVFWKVRDILWKYPRFRIFAKIKKDSSSKALFCWGNKSVFWQKIIRADRDGYDNARVWRRRNVGARSVLLHRGLQVSLSIN
jgi:hypothetical protein